MNNLRNYLKSLLISYGVTFTDPCNGTTYNPTATNGAQSVVTDQGDGTYIHNDGVSTNIVIDTRALSNPYDSSGNILTSTTVQGAITEILGLIVPSVPVTTTDSGSIDFTLTGQDITAVISGIGSANAGEFPQTDGAGNITWVDGLVTFVDNGDGTYTIDGNVIDTTASSNPVDNSVFNILTAINVQQALQQIDATLHNAVTVNDGNTIDLTIDANQLLTAEVMGVGSATDGQVFVADGNGSASWQTPTALVSVRSFDTTPGYLDDEILATEGVKKTILNVGSDEKLQLSFDFPNLAIATSLINTDTIAIYDGTTHRQAPISLLKDHDWYGIGTTSEPTTIGTSIWTSGKVTINDTVSKAMLYVKDDAKTNTTDYLLLVENVDVFTPEVFGVTQEGGMVSAYRSTGSISILANNTYSWRGTMSGGYNVYIGDLMFHSSNMTGGHGVYIGSSSHQYSHNFTGNISIGAEQNKHNIGEQNVILGYGAHSYCEDAGQNVFLGAYSKSQFNPGGTFSVTSVSGGSIYVDTTLLASALAGVDNPGTGTTYNEGDYIWLFLEGTLNRADGGTEAFKWGWYQINSIVTGQITPVDYTIDSWNGTTIAMSINGERYSNSVAIGAFSTIRKNNQIVIGNDQYQASLYPYGGGVATDEVLLASRQLIFGVPSDPSGSVIEPGGLFVGTDGNLYFKNKVTSIVTQVN